MSSRAFTADTSSDDDDDDDDDEDVVPLQNLSNHMPTLHNVAYNGRTNKPGDSCYLWWTTGALSLLGESRNAAIVGDPARRFLLQRMQHLIGGFSKHPGGPPDIFHSYLGLASLAIMEDESEAAVARQERPALRAVKRLDPALCISADAVRRMELGRKALLTPDLDKLQKSLVDMGLQLQGHDAPWLTATS